MFGLLLALIGLSDEDLVRRFREGDKAAFSELVLRYQDRVYGLCRRLLGDPIVAEDVAQDVFLALYRSLPDFRGEASLSTFIFRATVNHCKNRRTWQHRRRWDRHEPLEGTSGDDAPPRELADENSGTDRALHRSEAGEILHRALERLDESERSIILLRDLEDLLRGDCRDSGHAAWNREKPPSPRPRRAGQGARALHRPARRAGVGSPMDPWFARNRLSAYLDDALPPEERAEVEAQLAADPALRLELDQLRAAIALVREQGRVRAPEGFHDRVMARVALERPPAANRPMAAPRWRTIAAIGVAAAVLLVAPMAWWSAPRTSSQIIADAPELAVEPATKEVGHSSGEAAIAPSRVEKAREAARELRATPPDGAEADARIASGASGRARVSGLPDGVYTPSWDQDEASQEIVGGASGLVVNAAGVHGRPSAEWRITLAQTDVLFRLSEIARDAGGELQDRRGRDLEVRELDVEQNFVATQLVVPATRAGQVRDALLALGATESRALGEHAETDTVVFRVTATYQP